ncbi:DUF3025 domain-containing protein [Glaciecola petra]|uniref:DUF3025 domain-containing protein n=1 Tax=Glaciecola petra TaxID=3075602 RepID=A0ABU2ZNF5_9ALTE|nr:DUF3025 domain-containing protein [Aestuariibacter sp. P117]MDT0593930.1 DUF3025 domain-containing protein [Aestuariibacter sp. P117]
MAGQTFNTKTLMHFFDNECKTCPFNALESVLSNKLKRQIINYAEENQEISADICINLLRQDLINETPHNEFIAQDVFEYANESYEAYIYKYKKIPTRNNWHDFFNGMIWLQFPKTKQYFNQQHVTEIKSSQTNALNGQNRSNSKNRSAIRDRLTHFDECGLVLFTDQTWLENALDNHDWQQIFVKNKALWHSHIIPVVLGHALWEMLLNPFIGLTAKATVVSVSSETLTTLIQDNQQVGDKQRLLNVDEMLLTHLIDKKLIFKRKPWKPLPLLGIPGWSKNQQNEAFYANTDYFMPKSCK